VSEPTTVAELKAAIESEYGTYVATQTIHIGGARAFNVGDPVPVSHVKRGVVSAEQVAKATTKSGRAAAGNDESKG
jgi:hypothetical protein